MTLKPQPKRVYGTCDVRNCNRTVEILDDTRTKDPECVGYCTLHWEKICEEENG